MWGGVTDPGPTGADGDAMTHLPAAAATADAQVGKIMAELKAEGELDNTLVVLTADHGSVAGKHFYGKHVATEDYGYNNWYYGDAENDKFYNLPQDALLPLVATEQRRALLQRLDAAGLAQGPVRDERRRGGGGVPSRWLR